ncbi:MAG: nuclear transport factor 2 family protein [Aeromicrobium sp.]
MTDHEIRNLLERVQALEDRLAIYQLLATYGPAVDSVQAEVVSGMWASDGTYEPSGIAPFHGSEAVGQLVHQEPHQSYVSAGCAHVISLPHVTVDHDSAVATGHSRVYLHTDAGWQVERVSANRWELERGPDGWAVRRRLNHQLTGSEAGRELLAEGLRR